MREILFKGKQVYSGEWIYGMPDNEDCSAAFPCISPSRNYHTKDTFPLNWEVDPETVGQFTGLTDKNGKKIFEGDILEFEDCGETGYEYKEGFYFTNRAVVAWRHSAWEFGKVMYHNSCVLEEMYSSREDFIEIFKYSEIIGNIHDNPELLKGE